MIILLYRVIHVATHIWEKRRYICKSVSGNKYVIKHVRNVRLHFIGTQWCAAAYCNTDLSRWYWRRDTLPVSSNFFVNHMIVDLFGAGLSGYSISNAFHTLERYCSIIMFNNPHSLPVKSILALVDHHKFYNTITLTVSLLYVFASLSILSQMSPPILISFVRIHGQFRSFEVKVAIFMDHLVDGYLLPQMVIDHQTL